MISDEAVEAAEQAVIDAMVKHGPDGHIDGYEQIARAALEAAAPHIAAQAIRAAADALENQPARLKHQTVATLRLYASEPWRIEPADARQT